MNLAILADGPSLFGLMVAPHFLSAQITQSQSFDSVVEGCSHSGVVLGMVLPFHLACFAETIVVVEFRSLKQNLMHVVLMALGAHVPALVESFFGFRRGYSSRNECYWHAFSLDFFPARKPSSKKTLAKSFA